MRPLMLLQAMDTTIVTFGIPKVNKRGRKQCPQSRSVTLQSQDFEL
jgi:hypothetical protein